MRIVFVCTGNICRSPMAEAILRRLWREAGRDDLIVSSMGTHGLDAAAAEPFAQQVCRENGLDLAAHLSRPLVGEELQRADLVLCMEPAQQAFVATYFPWLQERLGLLAAWPGRATRKSAIPDPIGRPLKVYHDVYSMIDHHLRRILPDLLIRP